MKLAWLQQENRSVHNWAFIPSTSKHQLPQENLATNQAKLQLLKLHQHLILDFCPNNNQNTKQNSPKAEAIKKLRIDDHKTPICSLPAK
jgi:hypothetical protein